MIIKKGIARRDKVRWTGIIFSWVRCVVEERELDALIIP